MAKPKQSSIKKIRGGSGEKISFKKSSEAQKIYWDVLVGKNKITAANCPQSFTFDLYKLKAYLSEVEAEFNKLNIPYGERTISILPIAYNEQSRFTIMMTPSVSTAEGGLYHQFNEKLKVKKSSKLVSENTNYAFQLNAVNGASDWP